jgi:hypothetical protein
MVVIGGLMGDDVSTSEVGIPLLKDVPVLGHLFRTTSEARRRTNLLIFITPRIIKDQFDARDSTIDHADGLDGLLRQNGIEPWREEVLHSPDIDAVSEVTPYTGTKPSTIRPASPPKHMEQLDSAPSSAVESAGDHAENEEPIELHVSPKLPQMSKSLTTEGNIDRNVTALLPSPPLPEVSDQTTPEVVAPAERAVAESSTEVEASESEEESPRARLAEKVQGPHRFVILRLEDFNQAAGLPFGSGLATEDGGILFGVEIPSGSQLKAHNFFAEGGDYQYQIGEDTALLKALGTYVTADEALARFPGLSQSWHTLSPFEIMSLGRGPWTRL